MAAARIFPDLDRGQAALLDWIADAEALARQGSFAAVSPVIVSRTQVVGGAGNWRTTVTGVDGGYTVIRDWQTTDGAFFESADVRAMRKVVLLGAVRDDLRVLFPNRGSAARSTGRADGGREKRGAACGATVSQRISS